MSSDSIPTTPPTVDVEALEEATTVEAILASSNVTWASTDNRGAKGNGDTAHRPG